MTAASPVAKLVLWFMLVVIMWSPSSQFSVPAVFTLLRYGVFLAAALYFIFDALRTNSLRIPVSFESIFLVLFLLYTVASSLWGPGHPDTYLKSVLILTSLFLGLAVAYTMPLSDILETIFLALAFFVLTGIAVALLIPSVGVDSSWEHFGKWQGLSGQKNAFGANAAQSFITALCLPLKHKNTRSSVRWAYTRRAVYLILAFTAVIMAGSRGSQLMILVGLSAIALAFTPQIMRMGLFFVAAAVALPVMILVATTFEIDQGVVSFLGLSVDTSSRTLIWGYGFEQFSGRELFGFGVGGFWSEARLNEFKDAHGWVLDNFHNGFITVLLQGGIAGLTLVMLAMFSNLLFLNLSIDRKRDHYLVLVFAYFAIFVVANLHENTLGRSTDPAFVIFIITCLAIRPYVISQMTQRAPYNPPHMGLSPQPYGA